MMKLMIRRLSPQASKFVQSRLLETGTLRNALLHCSNKLSFCCGRDFSSFSDRNLSYRERLRSGIVDIKKDDAIDLFQEMIGSRPRPSLVDFSKLFSAVARTKQYDLVLDLCKQMELNGIAHNNYTLSIMINCFCRCRKLSYAFSAMGKIMKLGYEPNTVIFNTLFNGLCLQGRVSEAVGLVDRMVEMGHRPDLITFSTLINGLCLEGKVSQAVILIERMVENGCQPNSVTYGPVLNVMCKSGKTALAMELLRKMEERKIKLDAVKYSIIIDGLCKDGCLDNAFNLFNEMEMKRIKANNIMISGLCRKGSLSEANMLLRKMEEDGHAPDDCTYNTIVRAHLRGSDVITSAKLIEEMKRLGFSADASTIKMVIDMLSDGRLEKSFLDMLS